MYGYKQNEQQEIRQRQDKQSEEWKREEEFCAQKQRRQSVRRAQEFREEEWRNERHEVSHSQDVEQQIAQRRQQARRSEEEGDSRQYLRLDGRRIPARRPCDD